MCELEDGITGIELTIKGQNAGQIGQLRRADVRLSHAAETNTGGGGSAPTRLAVDVGSVDYRCMLRLAEQEGRANRSAPA